MKGQSIRAGLLAVFAALAMFSGPAKAAELIMFEQVGCAYCAQWNREVGDAYPKTAEGRAAPLRRVDLHASRPEELTFIDGVRFTPTFVLIENGSEIGRIEGYPGEAFFWGLLARLIETLPPATEG